MEYPCRILGLFGDNRDLRFSCANLGWRTFYFTEVFMKTRLCILLLMLCLFTTACAETDEKNDITSLYDENFSNIITYCESNAQFINGKYFLQFDIDNDASDGHIEWRDLTISPDKEIIYKETISGAGGSFIYYFYTTIKFKYGNFKHDKLSLYGEWEYAFRMNDSSTSQCARDSNCQLSLHDTSFSVTCIMEYNTFPDLTNNDFADTIWKSVSNLESYFKNKIHINLFEY